MPYRSVYIPAILLGELKKYGFNPDIDGKYEKVYKKGVYYLKFQSQKGDIGAILARYGVPREKIGICVNIVQENFGYVEDVYDNQESDVTPSENQKSIKYINQKPRQQALPTIFESAFYDQSSHLTPDGKRKRRKKR